MSTLDILNDILINQLQIDEKRIWAYNSDIDLPKDEHLFIILFINQKKPYANNIKYKETETGLVEVQNLNIVEDITISLVSKNLEAQERIYEVPLALNSTYSQNIQTQNRIHISPQGSILDNSFLEATSMLNRFDYKIRVFSAYEKINNVDYYDKYNFEIWTNNQTNIVNKTQITIQGE